MSQMLIGGVVAQRDKKPYLQISNENGLILQLTMAEARRVAHDILVTCSRIEADAMIQQYVNEELGGGEEAGVTVMRLFREFRMELDGEVVVYGALSAEV